MVHSKLQQLEQAAELTQLMQQQAEQANWDAVTEFEQQRQLIFKSIFPVNENEVSADLRQTLEKLINLNAELQRFCQQKKQDLQLEMQGLNKNKKAINAYKSV